MASINKVILIGNLGQDPEMRYTQGGQPVANFSLATSERWKNKQTGSNEEKTEWHRVVCWGKLAELARDYLGKGRNVYIEGRLQTRKWEGQDGNPRYTTEVVAQTLQFLGARGETSGRPVDSQAQDMKMASDSSEPPPFDSDDDIPF